MLLRRYDTAEWYRGPKLSQLTTMILDDIVIYRRVDTSYRPGGNSRYFADEVKSAQELTAEWLGALFDGMTTDDIVMWMGLADPPFSSRQALVLHNGGITPPDLESNAADNGWPSLDFRLGFGNITVEQIVAEVHRRRGLGQHHCIRLRARDPHTFGMSAPAAKAVSTPELHSQVESFIERADKIPGHPLACN